MKNGFRKRLLAGVLAAAVCRMLFDCMVSGNGTMAAAETGSAQAASDREKVPYDYMVLVNKAHKLPDTWENNVVLKETVNRWGETHLVEEKALEQFLKLQKECADEGIIIELDSTTRSVARQQELWDEWTIEKGEDYVKKYVAVPGYSEHHTGLAIDVCLEKDGRRIDDNDEMIAEKEQVLEDKNAEIAEGNAKIEALTADLAARDAVIAEKDQTIEELSALKTPNYEEMDVEALVDTAEDILEPLKQFGYTVVTAPSTSLAASVTVGEDIMRYGQTTHTVRMRNAPNSTGRWVVNLKYHQPLFVVREILNEDGEYWSLVSTVNGKHQGYVKSEFLELFSPSENDIFVQDHGTPEIAAE